MRTILIRSLCLLCVLCLAPLAGCRPPDASLAVPTRANRVVAVPAGSTVDIEPTQGNETPELPASEPVAAPDVGEELAAADDSATQLLRERLAPAKQHALASPPDTSEPLPRGASRVESLALPQIKLPAADVPKNPIPLPLEGYKTPYSHPALDSPPLAFARDPARPEAPRLPLGPRAYVTSPNTQGPHYLERFARDPEPPVLPSDDPSAGASQRVITASLALPAPVLPPPQFLAIPDPYEHARAVQLAAPLADADPPAVSFARPARPVLSPPAPKP